MYVDSNTINNKFTEPTVYFWRGSRIIFDHTPHQIAIQRRSLYGTVNCKQRVIPLHLHTLTIFLFYLFFLYTFVCCLSKQKKQNCMNERISRVSLCGLASDLFQNGSRGWLPILLSIVFLMFNGKGAKRRWGVGWCWASEQMGAYVKPADRTFNFVSFVVKENVDCGDGLRTLTKSRFSDSKGGLKMCHSFQCWERHIRSIEMRSYCVCVCFSGSGAFINSSLINASL